MRAGEYHDATENRISVGMWGLSGSRLAIILLFAGE